jgi:hypothetical protein
MTGHRGVIIGGVLAVLAAVIVAVALVLGGGEDGGSDEPVDADTGLPAELVACLKGQGIDVSSGIPHGQELHPALQACGQYLPDGGAPGPVPGAP